MTVRTKILIIEDGLDFAKMVRLRLESAGYDAEILEDAESGVQHLRSNLCDLIVLDLQMPGRGGYFFASGC